MTDRTDDYPDPDLTIAYLSRRGSKTFHVADPKRKTMTGCGKKRVDLIPAGWARGLTRQGLTACKDCTALIETVDPPEIVAKPETVPNPKVPSAIPPGMIEAGQ